MTENAIVTAIQKVREEISSGHRASIVIDLDNIPAMDDDALASLQYYYDRWDD